MRTARCTGAPWRHAGIAVLALGFAGSIGAQALTFGTLRIESVPAAAEVEVIGGKAGVTPLSISERDIYPNDYDDARGDLYGMVVLRHPGCEPLRHRVTATDIRQGLQLRLDCNAPVTPAAVPVTVPAAVRATVPASMPASAAAPATTPAPPAAPQEALSQRRLRQLQVLQELRDEGLITAAEEERVRRQILQPETGPGR